MIERLSVGGASLYLTQVERGTSPLRNNYGLHVGDDPSVVLRRRAALSRCVGVPILWMNQTHSARVALVSAEKNMPVEATGGVSTIDTLEVHLDAQESEQWPALPCDGVVVDGREWRQAPAVAVMTADCLPVLMSADHGRVVAAIHAGRVGFESGILPHTLNIFQSIGISVSDISVYIAPAICGACYEVPASMQEESAKEHPGIAATTRWGTPSLDLPRAALAQLRALGCQDLHEDGRCTREDTHWHSHRRDPRSGRQAAVIAPS